MKDLQSIAVVGGGLMGSGIAESSAVAGLSVILRDIDDAAIEAARARIERSLGGSRRRGKLTDDEYAAALERIVFTSDLADLAGVDLVIEAVPEVVELKIRVLADVAAAVGPDVPIASNTSSIAIAQLAAGVPHPERVLGLHFFSPVPVMRLVEVVRALDTSEAALAVGHAYVERIGKKAIDAKDRAGFIVNVLLVPYLISAIRLYEEGFTSAEAIDEGMRLGAGHPMGPLTLCDMIGLDVMLDVCDSMYEEFKQPHLVTPPLLRRMVAAGRYGRKSGRGFYDYRKQDAAGD